MKKFAVQAVRGQGMTEYLLVIGVVALVALLSYQYLGKVVRWQTGSSAKELAGLTGEPMPKQSFEALGINTALANNSSSADAMSNMGAPANNGSGAGGSNNSANHGTANSANSNAANSADTMETSNGSGSNGSGSNASNGNGSGGNGFGAGSNNSSNSRATSFSSNASNSHAGTSAGGNPPASSPSVAMGGLPPGLGAGGSSANSNNLLNEILNSYSKDAGFPQCTMQAGNPINIGNGLKYQQEIDYISPVGLDFVRHYNSKLALLKWQHNWQQRIVRVDGATVVAIRPDGKNYIYRLQSSGWTSDADISDRLTPTLDPTGQAVGWHYVSKAGNHEDYNLQGQLIALENRKHQRFTLQYQNNRLVQIADAFQHYLTLEYDATGRLSTLKDPAGQAYQFTYDAMSNLKSVTYPDGKSKVYHYENPQFAHALTGITDENGMRYATWRYDAQGRAISSEHGTGIEKVSLTYNNALSTTVTDALGTKRTSQFQEILSVKHHKSINQPEGVGCAAASSTMSYDGAGNVLSRLDFNGNLSCYAYNARNLEIYRVEGIAPGKSCPTDLASYTPDSRKGSVERKISTQWHPGLNLPVAISSPLRRTLYRYDDKGYLSSVTQYATQDSTGALAMQADVLGEPRVTSYRYNTQGKLSQVDGPRTDVQDVVRYEYDARAQLVRLTNALGHVTQIRQYDEHGHATHWLRPDGVAIEVNYDARGRINRVANGREVTTYQYDPASNLTAVRLPSGAQYRFSYDAGHRLTQIEDSDGNRMMYTLDKLGNRTKEEIKNAQGQLIYTHRREFDNLGRLWRDIGAANQSRVYEYDANGNVSTRIENLAEMGVNSMLKLSEQYDALNRVMGYTDEQGLFTSISYNQGNQVSKVIDPRGLNTRYNKNGLGETLSITSPDSGYSQLERDLAGNFTRYQDGQGRASRYSYDALNRIIKIQYQGVKGQDVSLKYDEGKHGVGHLTTISDASGSTHYDYDAQGALQREIIKIGKETGIIQYGYDTFGRMTQMRYPTGLKVNYTLDQQGRAASITINQGNTTQNLVKQIRYHASGQVSGFEFGDHGQNYRRTFDLDGRIQSYTLANTPYNLSYDSKDRVRMISTAQKSIEYGYDKMGRLVKNGAVQYQYDANGNRIAQTIAGAKVNYIYAADSNRLAQIQLAHATAKPLKYDASGLLQNDGQREFGYDAAGRLTQITTAQGLTQYQINALGQRVYKKSAQQETRYFYNQAGMLLSESAANKLTRDYIYLNTQLVAYIEAGRVYYVYNDHLDTPRLLTDVKGNTVWSWSNQDAFGSNPPDVEKITFNIRFPGQYADRETGLFYNYFRDYDPKLGRYIQTDPLGLKAGVNTYAYVKSNPLSYTDPLGLELVFANKASEDALAPHLDIIMTSPKGRELIDMLRDSPKTYTLYIYGGKAVTLSSKSVYINPNFHPMLETDCGLKPASTTRALAHELGHLTGVGDVDDATGEMMLNVNTWENPVMFPIEGYKRTAYIRSRP